MSTWKYIVTSTHEYEDVAAVTSDEALEAVKRLYGPCRVWDADLFGYQTVLEKIKEDPIFTEEDIKALDNQ